MNSRSNIDYSVVIPVYNSEKTLRELFTRIRKVLDILEKSFEVIFIEDCGSDKSWNVLCELKKEFPNHVTAIKLARNFGQHNAIMCGLHHVRGKFAITIDDDLQIPPEEIPKLISKQSETNCDLVYGLYKEKKHSRWRNLGSATIQLVYKKLFEQTGNFTAFRLIKKSLVDNVTRYSGSYAFVDGFLSWNTNSIQRVYIEHRERAFGVSNYNLKKLLGLSYNLFTNFSYKPLRLFMVLGILISTASVLSSVIVFLRWLWGGITVEGYTSLIMAITFLSGVQLMFIGLIAEYVGRIFLNQNNKPQFSISEKL